MLDSPSSMGKTRTMSFHSGSLDRNVVVETNNSGDQSVLRTDKRCKAGRRVGPVVEFVATRASSVRDHNVRDSEELT